MESNKNTPHALQAPLGTALTRIKLEGWAHQVASSRSAALDAIEQRLADTALWVTETMQE